MIPISQVIAVSLQLLVEMQVIYGVIGGEQLLYVAVSDEFSCSQCLELFVALVEDVLSSLR